MSCSQRLTAIAACLIIIVATGCGETSSHSGSHHNGAMGMSNSMSAPFDLAFIDAMVPHHEQALEMAKDARDAGLSDPDLIVIAADILTSQRGEIDQMRAWRNQWYPDQPTVSNPGMELGMSDHDMGMDMSHMDMDGSSVNTSFAAAMMAHHQAAIRMAKRALTRAQHPEIRRLARRIIAAQEAEIQVLRTHTGGV